MCAFLWQIALIGLDFCAQTLLIQTAFKAKVCRKKMCFLQRDLWLESICSHLYCFQVEKCIKLHLDLVNGIYLSFFLKRGCTKEYLYEIIYDLF